jgi:flagellar hook assembly protein FlgD
MNVNIIELNSNKYIQFDVVPDGGDVEISKANTTGVLKQNDPSVPLSMLSQNYPNPFNMRTKIDYQVPNASKVQLTIYDINGREIEKLVNGFRNKGLHSVSWEAGKHSTGVYFYKINTGSFSDFKKMLFLK